MALNKGLVLIFFVFVAGFHDPVVESPSAVDDLTPCNISNRVFAPGEKIVYKIYYNWNFVWIAAGEVVFEVKDDGNHYHISASGRTLKSYDWIFKVRDYYDSYLDKETLRPKRTIRKVHEGNYRLYDDVKYKHNEAIAISKKGKSKEDLDEEAIPLAECTHDILSSFYTMRNIDFAASPKEAKVPMNIYLDRKIYPLKVVYKGQVKDKRIRGLGQVDALLFEPEVIVGNVFSEDDGMKIWVTDDQNRIPLMVESPISVGSVKAVLRKHQGLKHPTAIKRG